MQKSLTGENVSKPTGFRPPPKTYSQASLNSFEHAKTVTFHEKPDGTTLAVWYMPPRLGGHPELEGGFKILGCENIHIDESTSEAIRIKGDRCVLSLRNINIDADIFVSVNKTVLRGK